MDFWYQEPYAYIGQHWHRGHHHKLLLEFTQQIV
jgi:hypothetical protein